MGKLLLSDARVERTDAARNRRRVLEAAARLFAQRGVENVTMDDIAGAARVGKGTLYRRFGDKAGLGIAILDARERDLQAAILGGPPPLGPKAGSRERLHAFVDAYLAYLERDLDLVVMCETASPGARFRSGVYRGWHLHVALLLREADVPRADTVAHLLLAMLDADLYRTLTRAAREQREDVVASVHEVIDQLLRRPERASGRDEDATGDRRGRPRRAASP